MRGIVVIPLQTHPVEAEQIGVQGIAILELSSANYQFWIWVLCVW